MIFYSTLRPGDLALAFNERKNARMHIVRLRQSRSENRKEPPRPDGDSMWTGLALCGTDGGKFYFSVTDAHRHDPDDEEIICVRCFQRWRAVDKPGVKGWTVKDISPVEEYPLPFAWRAVPLGKHPYDVPADGDVAAVVDGTGKVVGERREEVSRWQRGQRVVRIVRLLDDEARGYAVRYHTSDKPLDEKLLDWGSPAECRTKAHQLMAIGGYR